MRFMVRVTDQLPDHSLIHLVVAIHGLPQQVLLKFLLLLLVAVLVAVGFIVVVQAMLLEAVVEVALDIKIIILLYLEILTTSL